MIVVMVIRLVMVATIILVVVTVAYAMKETAVP